MASESKQFERRKCFDIKMIHTSHSSEDSGDCEDEIAAAAVDKEDNEVVQGQGNADYNSDFIWGGRWRWHGQFIMELKTLQ